MKKLRLYFLSNKVLRKENERLRKQLEASEYYRERFQIISEALTKRITKIVIFFLLLFGSAKAQTINFENVNYTVSESIIMNDLTVTVTSNNMVYSQSTGVHRWDIAAFNIMYGIEQGFCPFDCSYIMFADIVTEKKTRLFSGTLQQLIQLSYNAKVNVKWVLDSVEN